VVGWPVRHSRSPVIHGHWIEQYRLDAVYRREEIAPESFADFIARLSERGYVGANITIPHKEAALTMSEPDDRAQAVGAANTLWYDGGRLLSTNTDVEGFTANLDAAVPGWDKRAAKRWCSAPAARRARVVYGLIERGIGKINVVNRTPERREALQARSAGGAARALGGAAASAQPRGLLVNTTSLGMTGQPPLAIDLDRCPSRRGRRSGLCPAGNAVCWRPPAPRPRDRRWARHAAASGGSGLPDVVRGAPGGDAAIAGAGRDRPRGNKGILASGRGFTAGRNRFNNVRHSRSHFQGGMAMQTMTRRALGVAGLALMATARPCGRSRPRRFASAARSPRSKATRSRSSRAPART
jgi:shikimate dehydrogenase